MMDPFRKPPNCVDHLVVDAGGFIKHVDLQNLGHTIYSLPEVVSEIKDKNTRERLAVLSYELHFREPPVELIKLVTDFAKKTGDFITLSATDIKVIALTLLLEKEFVGLDHIRTEPVKSKTMVHMPPPTEAENDPRNTATPGFFLPPTDEDDLSSTTSAKRSHASSVSDATTLESSLDLKPFHEHTAQEPSQITLGTADSLAQSVENLALSEEPESDEGEDEDSAESVDDVEGVSTSLRTYETENVDEDDEGWITPKNIKQAYRKMGLEREEPFASTHKVACLTTDFSVQNVAKQMGLHIIGADGMLIKSLRTYALRCFGCFKVTHNTTKRFCPSCGNATLKRVAVTVDKHGQMKYHISTRRPLNTRGTKFSLPAFKGGKHAVNPVLSEDQPRPHFVAPKKSLQKLNVFDPDYVARDSPFLFNDLTSRAAQLGRRGEQTFGETKQWMAKNPNAVRRPRK